MTMIRDGQSGFVVGSSLSGVVETRSFLRPAAEVNASSQVVSRFVYGARVNVPEYMVRTGTTYRLVTDHLGSVRLVIDAQTGAIAQRLDYDEWGVVQEDTNPGFQPFGFAGGLYDPDTGLMRFGYRDYDAATGRWLARDPILFRGGMNFYAYVGNEPLVYTDPYGLAIVDKEYVITYGAQQVVDPMISMDGGFISGQPDPEVVMPYAPPAPPPPLDLHDPQMPPVDDVIDRTEPPSDDELWPMNPDPWIPTILDLYSPTKFLPKPLRPSARTAEAVLDAIEFKNAGD